MNHFLLNAKNQPLPLKRSLFPQQTYFFFIFLFFLHSFSSLNGIQNFIWILTNLGYFWVLLPRQISSNHIYALIINFNTKIFMQAANQYFVRTKTGMLQLSKGAYLTIMKRQKKSIKTLKKTKQITHNYQNIKTVKKPQKYKPSTHPKIIDQNFQPVEEMSFLASKGISDVFSCHPVYEDQKIFSMRSIPLIEMEWDNDCSSDWEQINEGIKKMSYSLSMAAIESFRN